MEGKSFFPNMYRFIGQPYVQDWFPRKLNPVTARYWQEAVKGTISPAGVKTTSPWTHVFHHSVLQILPPLLALLCVGEDVRGGAVGRALSQLLPIILHQGGPAHQLHGGELLQKVPEMESRWPGVKEVWLLLERAREPALIWRRCKKSHLYLGISSSFLSALILCTRSDCSLSYGERMTYSTTLFRAWDTKVTSCYSKARPDERRAVLSVATLLLN